MLEADHGRFMNLIKFTGTSRWNKAIKEVGQHNRCPTSFIVFSQATTHPFAISLAAGDKLLDISSRIFPLTIQSR